MLWEHIRYRAGDKKTDSRDDPLGDERRANPGLERADAVGAVEDGDGLLQARFVVVMDDRQAGADGDGVAHFLFELDADRGIDGVLLARAAGAERDRGDANLLGVEE